MEEVRAAVVMPNQVTSAYADRALPSGLRPEPLASPYVVAYMKEKMPARSKPQHSVLESGDRTPATRRPCCPVS